MKCKVKSKCYELTKDIFIDDDKTQHDVWGKLYNFYFYNSQIGGIKKIKKIKYGKYTFKIVRDTNNKDTIRIDKSNRCFIVNFYESIAILTSFGNEKECSTPELPKNGGGTIMLNFIIKYIKKYCPEIKEIQLTDNSTIKCNKKKIRLANLYTLTTGTTWYGKFGFVPIDNEIKKLYKKNFKIMKKIKSKTIKKFLEKYKIPYNTNELVKTTLNRYFKRDCSKYQKIEYKLMKLLDIDRMYGYIFKLNLK